MAIQKTGVTGPQKQLNLKTTFVEGGVKPTTTTGDVSNTQLPADQMGEQGTSTQAIEGALNDGAVTANKNASTSSLFGAGAQVKDTTGSDKAANEKTVAGWTTDWKSNLKVIPDAQLKELQNEAVDATQIAQANFTKTNGTVKRAQHARAVYATTRGEFKVPDSVPDAIAKGPFTPGANLRALVRISNVSGTVQKDGEKDLRGFALRLTDDKGHVQDIMMNTSEAFMAHNAKGAIVGIRVRGQGALQLGKAVLKGDMSLKDAIDLAKRGKAVQSSDVSVAAHTFWSRTPFQLGDKAVKFRLVPIDPHTQQPLVHGDTELEDDMRMRLQHEPVKYALQVQGYIDEKLTPINDAAAVWKSPFVTVGELTLPKLPKGEADATAKVHAAEADIDTMAYSISNRWTKDDASLKGLGDINSIREKAYWASAEGRGISGANGLRCPLGYG